LAVDISDVAFGTYGSVWGLVKKLFAGCSLQFVSSILQAIKSPTVSGINLI